MKLLLLGSAAGFVLAAGAQAADLPSKKAAPAQYVKICDAYGAGFFYIPGSDTCLRVGGYVRAEYQYTPGQAIRSVATGAITQVGSAQDTTGMEFRGRVDLDARTQSAWGTVQTVVQLRGTNSDGLRNTGSGSYANFGTTIGPVANGTTAMTMERAYIRFAGFTFGVGSENFVTMPSYFYHGNNWAGFPNGIKQLTYTATFGGGFSATIAIESMRDDNYAVSQNTTLTNGRQLVGNIRVDQGWGWAQLSGALAGNNVATNPLTGGAAALGGTNSINAYAIQGSARINLPMIAPGDTLHANLTYSRGILGLVGSANTSSISSSSYGRLFGGVLANVANNIIVNGAGTVASPSVIGTSTGWSGGFIFTHYWAPSWRSNIGFGYARYSQPTVAVGQPTALGNVTNWDVKGNLIWSPVARFDIGVELAYAQNKISIQNPSAAYVAAGMPGLSNNNWSGKLRVERTF